MPTPVGAADDRFVQIDVSTFGGEACGVRADGSAWCWSAATPETPHREVPGLQLEQIAVGSLHSCALDTADQPWCWLTVSYVVFGSMFSGSSDAPAAVAGGRRYQWIGVCSQYACALDFDGQELRCASRSRRPNGRHHPAAHNC